MCQIPVAQPSHRLKAQIRAQIIIEREERAQLDEHIKPLEDYLFALRQERHKLTERIGTLAHAYEACDRALFKPINPSSYEGCVSALSANGKILVMRIRAGGAPKSQIKDMIQLGLIK